MTRRWSQPTAGLVTSFCVLLSTAILAACSGGPNLKPETPTGVNLAGTWRLDRQASEDPQALIASIQEKMMKRMRPRRGGSLDDDPFDDDGLGDDPGQTQGGSSSGGGSGGRRGGQHGTQRNEGQGQSQGPQRTVGRFMPWMSYARALGPQIGAEGLSIEQSATRLVFVRGDDRRSFTPGADSVISVAEGVADQRSGWAGKEYVIDVRPQVGPHVTQRYGLSADGHRLVEKYTLTEEGMPKLEFTRVYDPGQLAPRSLPTSN